MAFAWQQRGNNNLATVWQQKRQRGRQRSKGPEPARLGQRAGASVAVAEVERIAVVALAEDEALGAAEERHQAGALLPDLDPVDEQPARCRLMSTVVRHCLVEPGVC